MAQMIKLGRTPGKYLRLMHHFQNGLPGAYHVMFSNAESARKASARMKNTMDRNPGWFSLVIIQRGCDVYVIKTQHVQKVVIDDGK